MNFRLKDNFTIGKILDVSGIQNFHSLSDKCLRQGTEFQLHCTSNAESFRSFPQKKAAQSIFGAALLVQQNFWHLP